MIPWTSFPIAESKESKWESQTIATKIFRREVIQPNPYVIKSQVQSFLDRNEHIRMDAIVSQDNFQLCHHTAPHWISLHCTGGKVPVFQKTTLKAKSFVYFEIPDNLLFHSSHHAILCPGSCRGIRFCMYSSLDDDWQHGSCRRRKFILCLAPLSAPLDVEAHQGTSAGNARWELQCISQSSWSSQWLYAIENHSQRSFLVRPSFHQVTTGTKPISMFPNCRLRTSSLTLV